MENFEWRDIPGFPGYRVSNFGQVKSMERVLPRTNSSPRRVPECILRPATTPSGHKCVVLGRGNTKLVHQLVLLAFEGPPPPGCEVLHRDHNPANNQRVNLKYGTRSENLQMDYDAGRRARAVIAVHPDGSRVRYRTLTEAGKAYGVKQPTMSKAIRDGHRLRETRVRFEYVD